MIYKLIANQPLAAIAQSVVRNIGSVEVTSSILVSSLSEALNIQGFFVFIKIHEKRFIFPQRLSVFHRKIFFAEMGLLSCLNVLL